jgi:hypothetical protein
MEHILKFIEDVVSGFDIQSLIIGSLLFITQNIIKQLDTRVGFSEWIKGEKVEVDMDAVNIGGIEYEITFTVHNYSKNTITINNSCLMIGEVYHWEFFEPRKKGYPPLESVSLKPNEVKRYVIHTEDLDSRLRTPNKRYSFILFLSGEKKKKYKIKGDIEKKINGSYGFKDNKERF